MKKIIVVAVFFALLVADSAKAENTNSSAATVADGSNGVVTAANFSIIRDFILKEGKRQTYCNRFNDNPYWGFTGFNAYLNPPDQGNINCETGKSDFPVLVIQTTNPIKYWHVRLDETTKELSLKQYYSKTEPKVLIQEVSEHFVTALKEIKKRVNDKKFNQPSEATR